MLPEGIATVVAPSRFASRWRWPLRPLDVEMAERRSVARDHHGLLEPREVGDGVVGVVGWRARHDGGDRPRILDPAVGGSHERSHLAVLDP